MIVAGKDFMPIVADALMRNQQVRMTANGSSMTPFIYDGDTVELKPLHSSPERGSIVLAASQHDQFVMHRVVRKRKGVVYLRGDFHFIFDCEGPFGEKDIIGKVVCSRHRKQVRVHNEGLWKTAGLVWMLLCPLGALLYRLAVFLRSFMRRIVRSSTV